MTQLLAVAGFGFLLGLRHAADADHVIAITTILNRSRRFAHATLIGALWGLGHTVTVVTVGVVIIVFNVIIPEPVELAMEFGVAIMLIVLGVLTLTGAMRRMTERFTPPAPMHGHEHAHAHAHEDEPVHPHTHAHLHGHGKDPALARHVGLVEQFGWFQLLRPVAVGLVHGMAGSAAVALLVLATISETVPALIYLLIFSLGVAVGMALLTTIIGLPFVASRAKAQRVNRWLTMGAGTVSLAFGLYMAYEIGIIEGLFGMLLG